MTMIIHVNQHLVRKNQKDGLQRPVVRVQRGRKGKSTYCQEAIIHGPSKVVYDPENPLPCGARVWIETEAFVELDGDLPFSAIPK